MDRLFDSCKYSWLKILFIKGHDLTFGDKLRIIKSIFKFITNFNSHILC